MVPVSALIVNHFIIIADVKLLNTHAGIILPMLIAPVTVIVYKQLLRLHAARISARRR
jgi:multiple sugar transport system permease protein